MKKPVVAVLAGLLLAGTAVVGAGSAFAADTTTSIPGGDSLEANMSTTNGWSGDPSCTNVASHLDLWGSNPVYAQNINNVSYINAYGAYSTWLTWRGASGHGTNAAHVSDSVHNTYGWYANLDGNVCIGTGVAYINGELEGSAYVPQQGGWFYANAGLN